MPITSMLLSLLVGCGVAEPPCVADIAVWDDLDKDGYGGKAAEKVCEVPDGMVEVAGDCDDADENLNPAAVETCDGIDNDCDGRIDDDANLKQWWFDGDGDKYGGLFQSQLACQKPGPDWVANADDCDDTSPAVNPDAQEVCGRVDEDCDGYIDEADDSVDSATFSVFFADKDSDGYGDPGETIEACRLIAGYVLAGNDCNDRDPLLTQKRYWEDDDGDGYGDPDTSVMGCANAPAGTVENDDDCDDTDADILYESDWFVDDDGDLFGSGVSLDFACIAPEPGTVRLSGDCDESNPAIHPDATDICEDGIDQDCSGSDIPCGPVGSFLVEDGPQWGLNPPVYNCLEACAQVFGGTSNDYQCSTSASVINNSAFLSGWGDQTFCFSPQSESFSLEQAANPGYNCGGFGCAYSAYVRDNCVTAYGSGARNYCWPN